MVSKASEDFPDPETPVTTVMALCGISKSMFLRLWTRAPRTTILSLEASDIRIQEAAIQTQLRMGVSEESERPAESFYYKAGKVARYPLGIRAAHTRPESVLEKSRRRTAAAIRRRRRSGLAERSSDDSIGFRSRERLRCRCFSKPHP